MRHAFVSSKAAATDATLVDGPKWNDGHVEPVSVKTGNYVFADADGGAFYAWNDAADRVLTFPQTLTDSGWTVTIKNLSITNKLTITPTVATVDGQASLDIPSRTIAKVIYDGTNYRTGLTAASAVLPANYVMASDPSSANNMLRPRALASADIPDISATYQAVSGKDTDGTLSADSDARYSSQKAVKTYVDAETSRAETEEAALAAEIAAAGTVLSVDGSAQQGVESDVSGSAAAITRSGTLRGCKVIVTKSGAYSLADSDRGKVLVFADSSNDAITLTLASGNNFTNGWFVIIKNKGTSTLTFSGTSCTVNGNASLVVPAGTVLCLISDGGTSTTNYHTELVSPLASQTQNLVLASPNGASGMMSPRALVAADIPNIAESQVTNLTSDLAGKQASLGFTPENVAHKDAASGYAGLDGSGLLKPAEFPVPSASTLGGVKSLAAVAHNFLTSIGTDGGPVAAQPAFADISGAAKAAQTANTLTGVGFPNLPSAVVKNVINTQAGNGNTDLYTVAAGKRATLALTVSNESGGSISIALQIKRSGTYYNVIAAAAVANLATQQICIAFNTYPILEAGDAFSINCTASGLNLFGYVIEYSNTEPLKSAYLLTLSSGGNTIYTCPANTIAVAFNVSGTNAPLRFSNASGATRTYTWYCVPNAGSFGTTNNVSVIGNTVANNTNVSLAIGQFAMAAGDFIVVKSDSGAAGQFASVQNILEYPTGGF